MSLKQANSTLQKQSTRTNTRYLMFLIAHANLLIRHGYQEKCGFGSTATVWRAVSRNNEGKEEIVAAKIFDLYNLEIDVNQICNEVKVTVNCLELHLLSYACATLLINS